MTERPHPNTEPRADQREAARELWLMFVALQQEGFDERQSLAVLAVIGRVLAGFKGQS